MTWLFQEFNFLKPKVCAFRLSPLSLNVGAPYFSSPSLGTRNFLSEFYSIQEIPCWNYLIFSFNSAKSPKIKWRKEAFICKM